MTSTLRAGLLVVAALAMAPTAHAAFDWFPPRIADGRIVLVPKPHYNSRDELGLSVEAIHPFRTGMQSSLSNDSEFRLFGRIHTTGNGSAEASSVVVFGDGRWYTKAKLEYMSLTQRFWGVGPDTPSDAKELFRPQDVRAYVELFHEIVDGFRVGGRVEWNDYKYVEVEDGGLLDTEPYPGVCCDNATGAGLVWELDRRDNVYDPQRGIHAQGFFMFFSRDLSGDYAFQNVHLDVRSYHRIGDGVIALQAFAFALFGDAPIWRYAAVGGRIHSRGYQRGRFVDRRMAAAQVEWRRPLAGRLDGVVFGGIANADRVYNNFKLRNMRPSAGVGLRLHVREERDLILRGDIAVGQESVEGYLSFGHAF